jgi:hypothetical protein
MKARQSMQTRSTKRQRLHGTAKPLRKPGASRDLTISRIAFSGWSEDLDSGLMLLQEAAAAHQDGRSGGLDIGTMLDGAGALVRGVMMDLMELDD